MTKEERQKVREVARKNGWPVSDRGPISKEVLDWYKKHHG